MIFRTAYSKERGKPTTSGEKEMMTYTARLTKDGKKVLVKNGKINIYERIQANKEEADIHTILDRAKKGDVKSIELLQKGAQGNGKGGIIDLTQAPKNLIEAQQKLIDAQATWDKLPKELKDKFNNNMTEFLAGASDGRVQEYIDSKKPKQTETTKETTKETTTTKEEVL